MKKSIYALLSVLLSTTAFAQEFIWAQPLTIDLTLNPEMVGYTVTSDGSGNAYVAGFKDEQSPWSPDILGNVFLRKYSPEGTQLFDRTFLGKASVYDMATDATGNTVIAIAYNQLFQYESLNIDAGELGLRGLVIKLDSEGHLMWHYEFPWTQWSFPLANSVSIGQDGHVYVAHNYFNDSFVTKFSSDGDILMTITQLNANRVSGVSTDNEGSIYVAGSCAGFNANYQGVDAGTSLQYNVFLVKYNPNGGFEWVKYVEDITCSSPKVEAVTPDRIYFSGDLHGMFAFDNILPSGTQQSFGADFFLARLNAAGEFLWVANVPQTGSASPGRRHFIDADANGNLYFGGIQSQNIDWGNGVTSSANGQTVLVLKYDPQGVIQFAATAGGSFQDRCDAIAITSNNDILLTGMCHGNATFGNHVVNGVSGDSQAYLARLSQESLGLGERATGWVYPNPTDGLIHLLPDIDKMSVYNMLGQKLQDILLQQRTANLGGLPSGAYVLIAEGYAPFRLIRR